MLISFVVKIHNNNNNKTNGCSNKKGNIVFHVKLDYVRVTRTRVQFIYGLTFFLKEHFLCSWVPNSLTHGPHVSWLKSRCVIDSFRKKRNLVWEGSVLQWKVEGVDITWRIRRVSYYIVFKFEFCHKLGTHCNRHASDKQDSYKTWIATRNDCYWIMRCAYAEDCMLIHGR